MDYQRYKCPICGGTLSQYKDENEHANNGVDYDKTMYRCKKDDVWLTIEVPLPVVVQTS